MKEDITAKAPWYDRFYDQILTITGLRVAIDFIKTLGSPQKAFQEQKQLLARNLQDEDALCKAEFKAVLNRWGIYDEETLTRVLWLKRVEMWCGVALIVLGLGLLAGQVFFPTQGTLGYLQGMAVLSVAFLGAILALTAYWRIQVFRRGKFVPFLHWFNSLFSRDKLLAMSAIPPVNVSDTDITVQTLNQIFGTGWANLAHTVSGGAGDGPTLIYNLLGTLNSICTCVVAWIVIMSIVVSNVGAAQEGRSLGGKYSSAWVPIRFAFSFSAITPVIAGLNAMQVLVLAAIGFSVDLSNQMWTTGLNYIEAHGGQITAQVSKATQTTGQQLAVGSMRSMTLLNYLIVQVECSGGGQTAVVRHDTETEIILSFTAPATCKGDAQSLLRAGDLGAIVIPKSGNPAIDAARENGVYGLMQKLAPAADNLGANKTLAFSDRAAIQAASQVYTTAVAQSLANLANAQDADAAKALSHFREVAKTQGWGMAGSYYWTMSVAATNAIEKMRDASSYSAPNMDKLAPLLYKDWYTLFEPTLADLTKAGLIEGQVSEAAMAATDQSLAGIMSRSFAPFNELPKMASTLVSDPDAIIFLSRMSRYVMNIVEGAVVATAFVSATSSGVKAAADSSLWGKAGDALTGGAVSGVITGASKLAEYALYIVSLLAIPMWGVAWFYAYAVPAIPYLCWMAALVGWVILCVEAVIAAPLWLVGHSLPDGEGFAGTGGRAGYMLLLSVIIRPTLLVISMFVCIMVIMSTGMLIGYTFKPFVDSLNNIAGSFVGVTSAFSMFVILGSLIGICTWKLFTLVTAMPDRIIRWVGQLLHNLGSEGQELATQTQAQLKDSAVYAQKGAQKFNEHNTGGKQTQLSGQQMNNEHSMGDVGAKKMTQGRDDEV